MLRAKTGRILQTCNCCVVLRLTSLRVAYLSYVPLLHIVNQLDSGSSPSSKNGTCLGASSNDGEFDADNSQLQSQDSRVGNGVPKLSGGGSAGWGQGITRTMPHLDLEVDEEAAIGASVSISGGNAISDASHPSTLRVGTVEDQLSKAQGGQKDGNGAVSKGVEWEEEDLDFSDDDLL